MSDCVPEKIMSFLVVLNGAASTGIEAWGTFRLLVSVRGGVIVEGAMALTELVVRIRLL